MAIITYHTVECPYCGQEKYIVLESEELTKAVVVHCKGAVKSSPGCDRIYAVQLVLLPRIQIYELLPADTHPIERPSQPDHESPAVQ